MPDSIQNVLQAAAVPGPLRGSSLNTYMKYVWQGHILSYMFHLRGDADLDLEV